MKTTSGASGATRLRRGEHVQEGKQYGQILPPTEGIMKNENDKRRFGCNKSQKGRASHVGKQYGQIFRTAEVFLNSDNDKQSRGCNKT